MLSRAFLRCAGLLIGSLWSAALLAQTPTISLTNFTSSVQCAGAPVSVSFTTTGTFETGNTFRVQISTNYGSTYTTLSGSSASSPVSVTLPAPTNTYDYFVVRVIADKPAVSSGRSNSFQLIRPATAELTGSTAGGDFVNPSAPTGLRVSLTGGSPYIFTLTDSTRFSSYNDYPLYEGYIVNPAKTTTYALATVRNGCGPGTVKGSTTVNVNRTGFILTQVSGQVFCVGSSLLVQYSSAQPLPADTKFVAEFIDRNNGNSTVSVPIDGSASPLRVNIPTGLPPSYAYNLRISSTNAGVGALFSGSFQVTRPSTARLSGTASIRRGDAASLSIDVSGTSAWRSIGLSDGSVVVNQNQYNYVNQQTVPVRPTVTTTYSLTGLVGDCPTGAVSGSAVVTVLPSLRIDSLSSYRVCTSDTIRAYISADDAPLPTAPFAWSFVVGSYVDAKGNLSNLTTLASVVKVEGRVLTVILPKTLGSLMPGLYYAQLVLPNAGQLSSAYSAVHARQLSLSAPPNAAIQPYYTNVLDRPQQLGLTVNTSINGRNTELTMSDGITRVLEPLADQPFSFYYGTTVYSFVKDATPITVKSVRNSCGVGTTTGQVSFTVQNQNQQQLFLPALNGGYCPGAGLKVMFNPVGQYGADNTFRLELSDRTGSFSSNFIDTVRADGSFGCRLPVDAGNYSIRVVSSNPVIRSNQVSLQILRVDVGAYVNVQYTAGQGQYGYKSGNTVVALPGWTGTLGLTFSGIPPYRYELSDGTRGQTSSSYATQPIAPSVTTVYSVKSLTSSCGISQTSTSQTVSVQPFLIWIGSVASLGCAGNPVLIPFKTTGLVPPGLTYNVQMTTSSELTNFTEVAGTLTADGLQITPTADMVGKGYYFRVVARVGTQTYVSSATTSTLSIRSAPIVRLTTPNGQATVQLSSNQTSAELQVTSPVYDTFYLLLSDGRLVSASDKSSIYVTPPNGVPTTYSIQSVYNGCGYGSATGTVLVNYKTGLRNLDAAGSVCSGKVWRVNYERVGEFEPGNRFVFSLRRTTDGLLVKLTETTAPQGPLDLPLPATILPGSYGLVVTSTAPAQTLTNGGLTVDIQTPVAATLSGTASAYAGQQTYLTLNLTGSTPATIILSDGSRSVFSYAPYGLVVSPAVSTTYTIALVNNSCGLGTATGRAVVTVLPAGANTIRCETNSQQVCTSQKQTLFLTTTGTFDPANTFTAQLSDSTGNTFRAIATEGKTSPLTVTIPANVLPGSGYRLRVVSDKPAVEGSANPLPIQIATAPTGNLTGTATVLKGDTARLTVTLTGTPPWYLLVGSLYGNRQYYAQKSPFVIAFKPDTTAGYQLAAVSDAGCGIGSASGSAVITVTRVLALEPALSLDVQAYPNPVTNALHISGRWAGREAVRLELVDAAGRVMLTESVRRTTGAFDYDLDMSRLTGGTYLLRVNLGERGATLRIVKP